MTEVVVDTRDVEVWCFPLRLQSVDPTHIHCQFILIYRKPTNFSKHRNQLPCSFMQLPLVTLTSTIVTSPRTVVTSHHCCLTKVAWFPHLAPSSPHLLPILPNPPVSLHHPLFWLRHQNLPYLHHLLFLLLVLLCPIFLFIGNHHFQRWNCNF